jgi:integrase
VLEQPLAFPLENVRARRPKRLPTVLTQQEVRRVLSCLHGRNLLITQLLYGSGLRLGECVRLRVKDVNFARRQILVRDTKGRKDRCTILPSTTLEPLEQHLARVKRSHEEDLERGFGAVYMELTRLRGHLYAKWKEFTMPRTRPPYPEEFRKKIVELVRSGRSPHSLSKQFEPTAATIGSWVKKLTSMKVVDLMDLPRMRGRSLPDCDEKTSASGSNVRY